MKLLKKLVLKYALKNKKDDSLVEIKADSDSLALIVGGSSGGTTAVLGIRG